MQVEQTERGFEIIYGTDKPSRLVQQSSAIGNYYHSVDKPGSSFLWVGEHHLDKEQVQELICHLELWVETGSLTGEGSVL